ncbi:PREDICTED: midkine [Myotis brandtii]|uniref:midkine n=1 Tax=Myotis brandtii TaxID=109478 RepID=UPI0007047C5E|nr:PREDICTED: midkine [Myotis brandtii]
MCCCRRSRVWNFSELVSSQVFPDPGLRAARGANARSGPGGPAPALTPGALLPADCKYKFESWGSCDGSSGTKARQGTLKKARYNAQCQETIRVTKPCAPKTKAKAKAKKGKGKD